MIQFGTRAVKSKTANWILTKSLASLMGQRGSGKMAVVQDIVLPTLDFLFGLDATLIVCAKWSQAENISTESHKAALVRMRGLDVVHNLLMFLFDA